MLDLIDLNLRMAGQSVHDYADEVLRDHVAAMSCGDCEAVLALGIRAVHQLQFVENVLREGDAQGLLDYTNTMRKAIEDLYAVWLTPCPAVARWIDALTACGYLPENLEQYRDAKAEVTDTLQQLTWLRAASDDLLARTEQERW